MYQTSEMVSFLRRPQYILLKSNCCVFEFNYGEVLPETSRTCNQKMCLCPSFLRSKEMKRFSTRNSHLWMPRTPHVLPEKRAFVQKRVLFVKTFNLKRCIAGRQRRDIGWVIILCLHQGWVKHDLVTRKISGWKTFFMRYFGQNISQISKSLKLTTHSWEDFWLFLVGWLIYAKVR